MNRTSKPERRRNKRDWLSWRKLSQGLTRTGNVTAIKPDPSTGLAAFCRWKREELPTISMRIGLTVCPTEKQTKDSR